MQASGLREQEMLTLAHHLKCKAPNAGHQARPIAEATDDRRLSGIACMLSLGGGVPQTRAYDPATAPADIDSGTSCTVVSGKAGPPPHSRRSTGMTSVAKSCICSSISAVLYPPASNQAVNKKSS